MFNEFPIEIIPASNGFGIIWREDPITTDTTVAMYSANIVDASGNDVEILLPENPSIGIEVILWDAFLTAEDNVITIDGNGENIESLDESLVFDIVGRMIKCIYVNDTIGWKVVIVDGTSGIANTIKYESFLEISEDTSFSDLVPAGFVLSNVLIEELGSNQVRINIGTTEGGDDVLFNQLIPADETQNLVFNRFFSKTTDQTIYINSSDWNSSSLNINFHMTKIY